MFQAASGLVRPRTRVRASRERPRALARLAQLDLPQHLRGTASRILERFRRGACADVAPPLSPLHQIQYLLFQPVRDFIIHGRQGPARTGSTHWRSVRSEACRSKFQGLSAVLSELASVDRPAIPPPPFAGTRPAHFHGCLRSRFERAATGGLALESPPRPQPRRCHANRRSQVGRRQGTAPLARPDSRTPPGAPHRDLEVCAGAHHTSGSCACIEHTRDPSGCVSR